MPLDTILLLDTSGSMAGRGITELKRACRIFLDGVEETARQTGLKENVAVVEFHTSARIVHNLTTDYNGCRRAVDSLRAGGTTAMLDGLLEALKEILKNGGIVRVCGLAMTPRVILMTDGEPTDREGPEKGKKKIIATAIGFGPGWRKLGLPHPVPIACVGCGACDTNLLQAIAKLTNGMYVIVGNVSELSTFFRRQVLLIRFAMRFASDMRRLRSQIALAAFLRELGEKVEDAELEAMMKLLLAMLVATAGPAQNPRAIASGATTEQRRVVTIQIRARGAAPQQRAAISLPTSPATVISSPSTSRPSVNAPSPCIQSVRSSPSTPPSPPTSPSRRSPPTPPTPSTPSTPSTPPTPTPVYRPAVVQRARPSDHTSSSRPTQRRSRLCILL